MLLYVTELYCIYLKSFNDVKTEVFLFTTMLFLNDMCHATLLYLSLIKSLKYTNNRYQPKSDENEK